MKEKIVKKLSQNDCINIISLFKNSPKFDWVEVIVIDTIHHLLTIQFNSHSFVMDQFLLQSTTNIFCNHSFLKI